MKFISVVALLAPVVLAAPQVTDVVPIVGWIRLLNQKCPNMPEQCLDIAKKVHDPRFDIDEARQAAEAMPGCTAPYGECINNLTDDADFPTSPVNLVQCLLQIAPDHFKYFLDPDSAEIPIPRNQNCALRELHRVAHIELGPLA